MCQPLYTFVLITIIAELWTMGSGQTQQVYTWYVWNGKSWTTVYRWHLIVQLTRCLYSSLYCKLSTEACSGADCVWYDFQKDRTIHCCHRLYSMLNALCCEWHSLCIWWFLYSHLGPVSKRFEEFVASSRAKSGIFSAINWGPLNTNTSS